MYANAREYMADIARIFREEFAELASLGCTYVQIDVVPIPVICDTNVQATIERGAASRLSRLFDLYVDTINDAIRDRPPGMTVVVHMCRGNEGVAGLGSGGYEPIAERVFGRLKVDGYLLEYDTPRTGDFAPLRFLPKEAIAVLGLISTKVTELETRDALKRRIDEAARVIELDRLGLCPQCGFASLYRYDRMGHRRATAETGALGRHGPRGLGLRHISRAAVQRGCFGDNVPGEETSQGARECKTATPRAAVRRSSSKA